MDLIEARFNASKIQVSIPVGTALIVSVRGPATQLQRATPTAAESTEWQFKNMATLSSWTPVSKLA
jgi:hypothetical protein